MNDGKWRADKTESESESESVSERWHPHAGACNIYYIFPTKILVRAFNL